MEGANVVHETAELHPDVEMAYFNVIGPNVKIGEGVKIGSHCIIHEGCVIGARTQIMNHVELRSGTIVGQDCYVDSGVRSSGRNTIGDKVTLRYASIIARGCAIGDKSYICPQVMTNNLDHKGKQVGGAHVGKECFIGTQTVLGAGITIAEKVVVGSCSMVTRSIEEPGTYIGVPAKRLEKKD